MGVLIDDYFLAAMLQTNVGILQENENININSIKETSLIARNEVIKKGNYSWL